MKGFGRKRKTEQKRWIMGILMLFCCVPWITGCVRQTTDEVRMEIPEQQKLTVYTSHKPEVYQQIVEEFEDRTGIYVDIKTGGTHELIAEIREEGEETDADLLFGGGIESYERNQDLFLPYTTIEELQLKQEYQKSARVWTPFSELPIVFIYNTKLLTEHTAPTGWGELISPQWKGKIAFADPQKSASSCTALVTMLQALGKQEEEDAVLQAFADNLDGRLLESSGAVLDEVAAGNLYVGITLEETARKYMDRGEDLGILMPREGSSAVPDACGLVKYAHHTENARAFLDFIVSEDVQNLAASRLYRRSVRTDVIYGQEEDLLILDYDLDWAVKHQDDILITFDWKVGA